MINLNYMNYISDINVGSALFTKAHGEKGAWGVGATFISYGDIKEVLPDNVVTGASLSAKDISVNGFYSRDLNERWRGGLSLKFLYSGLADYTKAFSSSGILRRAVFMAGMGSSGRSPSTLRNRKLHIPDSRLLCDVINMVVSIFLNSPSR